MPEEPDDLPVHRRHRFAILLGSLVLLLLLSPALATLMPGRSEQAEFFIGGAFSLVLLSGVMAISERKQTMIAALIMLVPTLALRIAALSTVSLSIEIAADLAGFTFIAYLIGPALVHLFTTRSVTLETIHASLCIYLLIAVMFGLLFTLLESAAGGSFDYRPRVAGAAPRDNLSLYFSLVTLTTLGYGDITPVTPFARALASLEAVVGQVYLTVLVARLVGMHIARTHQAE